MIYLGRYPYRGVIREQDILACKNSRVSFRYRNAATGKSEKRSLSGADFLWLLLQHVLFRLPVGQLLTPDRLAALLAELRSEPL